MYLNIGHEEYKIKKEFQNEQNFQPFQINLTALTRKEIEVKFDDEEEGDIITVDVDQFSNNDNEDCHKKDCQNEDADQKNYAYEDCEEKQSEKKHCEEGDFETGDCEKEDYGEVNSGKGVFKQEIYYSYNRDSFV